MTTKPMPGVNGISGQGHPGPSKAGKTATVELRQASIELGKHLSFDHGPTALVETKNDNGSYLLKVRLAKSTMKEFIITSKRDAFLCYRLFVEYYKRFKHALVPLDFHVAFDGIDYKLDDMISDVHKNAGPKISIPNRAEELWQGKKKTPEDLVEYFGRVWARYLEVGLDSATLKRLDRKLWNAIKNYPSLEKKPWPEEYRLPSNYTKIANALQKADRDGFDVLSPAEKVSVSRRLFRSSMGELKRPEDHQERPVAPAYAGRMNLG